jgi:NAD(P)-dependent dehydrogenase (short-subunit alcohol dehydrogenase family)
MRLDGRVVLIAGATGGLGQAVTPAFLQAGATLAVVARQMPQDRPEGMLMVTGDVTDEADVRRMVAEVIQRAGRIDCLVNLVGGFSPGRVTETETSVWQKMLALNVTSAFLLSKTVAAHMVQRRAGRIVHIGSQAAVYPFPGAAAYIVAKSALVALVKVLTLELGGSGIRVNGVLPTTIDTPVNRTSMPQADFSTWVKPESIAQLLVYLCSEEAAAIHGALIPVGSS